MARLEQDREDLMREATALVRRVELQLPGDSRQRHTRSCVVGTRRTGELSIFVEADPVFQFNAAGELRRGYWNGRLVKAEGGRLVQLERRRTDTETQLVRHEFTAAQSSEYLGLAEEMLNLLHQVLRSGELVALTHVPSDLDVTHHLASWLDSLPRPLKIASAPNVRL